MPKRKTLVVAFGDLHVGSTVALCHKHGVALEDGGRYMPNEAQVWLWEKWVQFWGLVRAHKKAGARVVAFCNGEFIDGRHHESTQLSTSSPEIMAGAAIDVMSVAMPHISKLYVTRGTEAHSGHGAASDFAIARELGAVVDPGTGQSAAYQWRVDVDNVVFDVAHHISGSARISTRGTNIRSELVEAILDNDAPDVLIRSHVHQYATVGNMFGNRQAIVLPAWQLKTAFAHRVTRRRRQSVGGVFIRVENGIAQPAEVIQWDVPLAPPSKA